MYTDNDGYGWRTCNWCLQTHAGLLTEYMMHVRGCQSSPRNYFAENCRRAMQAAPAGPAPGPRKVYVWNLPFKKKK
ncbi:hypothetical protein H4R18_001615 [Coemansia javaensis]|uniref:Uncharacterized protein n=1 Tax=Coemansia javaensis TaxID=2761396 RepID=A0A9W8HEK7_9FUNG|nr:hypothetical protein H4R18_001615 [Coemansia javaensis]